MKLRQKFSLLILGHQQTGGWTKMVSTQGVLIVLRKEHPRGKPPKTPWQLELSSFLFTNFCQATMSIVRNVRRFHGIKKTVCGVKSDRWHSACRRSPYWVRCPQNLMAFNVQVSAHRKYIPFDIFPTRCNITQFIYFWKTALHVSGGISTQHQEHTQLYLQYLVLVTPLLLPAAIVEDLELIWVWCGNCIYLFWCSCNRTHPTLFTVSGAC